MVIKFHKKYLKRLAKIYLDLYDKFGHVGAQEWYMRTLKTDKELCANVNLAIKEEALLRGHRVKE